MASICVGHQLAVCGHRLVVVDDTLRVVGADNATTLPLQLRRRLPRLEYKVVGQRGQHRHVTANEIGGARVTAAVRDRVVDAKVLKVERGAADPHPVGAIQRPVGVDQIALEHPCAGLPVLPQIAASEKTRDDVPPEMVHPALEAQLVEKRVDQRETGATMLPRGQTSVVTGPVDGARDGVVTLVRKIRRAAGDKVEELAPEHLTLQRHGWSRMLLLIADSLNLHPEATCAEAAQCEVGRQQSSVALIAGEARVRFGFLEREYALSVGEESLQGWGGGLGGTEKER